MWRVLLWSLAGMAFVPVARAQQLPPIEPGALVRVVTSDEHTHTGRLLPPWPHAAAMRLCRGAGAECRFERDPRIVRIAVPDIVQVQVPRGSQWRRGLIVGGAVGLVVGGTLALLAAGMECSDCDREPTAWPIAPLGVVTFGLLGTAIGATTPRWSAWPD